MLLNAVNKNKHSIRNGYQLNNEKGRITSNYFYDTYFGGYISSKRV